MNTSVASHNSTSGQRAAHARWKADQDRRRIRHVQQRARERYQLKLSPEDIIEMEALIAIGECRDYRKGRVELFFRGRQMLVAIENGEILTCLPQEAVLREQAYQRRAH